MGTTFGVKVRSVVDLDEEEIVEVARRSSGGIRLLNALVWLLPAKTPVIPLDNTPQGIFCIGDILKEVETQAYRPLA